MLCTLEVEVGKALFVGAESKFTFRLDKFICVWERKIMLRFFQILPNLNLNFSWLVASLITGAQVVVQLPITSR